MDGLHQLVKGGVHLGLGGGGVVQNRLGVVHGGLKLGGHGGNQVGGVLFQGVVVGVLQQELVGLAGLLLLGQSGLGLLQGVGGSGDFSGSGGAVEQQGLGISQSGLEGVPALLGVAVIGEGGALLHQLL